MAPSPEDFARWRDDPVTRWVMDTYAEMAEANRLAWMDASWVNGAANPLLLKELKTRSDAYLSMAEMEYHNLTGDERD